MGEELGSGARLRSGEDKAWMSAVLVGGGYWVSYGRGEGAGRGPGARDGRERGWELGSLQEILFGSSKSAPEAHYRCPQGAGRGEGGRSS